jgi:hypothetical protein
MNARKLMGSLAWGVAAVVLAAAVAAAAPRQPMALPPVGATFASPYDAVWEATLGSLGVVKVPVADKAAGRIETEPFSFAAPIGGGLGIATNVVWIAMRITVARTSDNRTSVQVEPLVHDAFFPGVGFGPTNNPWADLFARIQGRLASR